MKTEREKPSYPLPEDFSELSLSYVRKDQIDYALCRVLLTSILKRRNESREKYGTDILAMPVYIAENLGSRTLELYPTPDDTYEVIVRYHPPEKEF